MFRSKRSSYSDTFKRRGQSVGRNTARLRGDMAKILREELQAGTQKQLYDRTPLPVSRDMMKSIGVKMMGNAVQVGYGFYGKAKYAKYRINMTGRSPKGGHQLDMHPAKYLRDHADPRIARRARELHRQTIAAR